MQTAREIDRLEMQFVRRGQAFFHVSGAGHEAMAALASHLIPADWLHLHYRDKALLFARGVPIDEFFNSLLCKAPSHSAGRQMSAHLSCPRLHVLSLVGPVGNNALQAAGVAAAIKHSEEKPIVVCCVGDGTTQEGEFHEAVADAVRHSLPVLYIVEDNRYAISTETVGNTFFNLPGGRASSFHGLPIDFVNGRDPRSADAAFVDIVKRVRDWRKPALLVLSVERLSDHTHTDDQVQYRDADELNENLTAADPIRILEQYLIGEGISPTDLQSLKESAGAEVQTAADAAMAAAEPLPCFDARKALPGALLSKVEYRGDESEPRLTMREALNRALHNRIESDPRVVLYGEDIEDPKGDVFGVTRGLSTRFPGRVINSPLSEATIIGTCIGRALAGQRPVAFIQFADFLPLAYNQIHSELASMYWRSNGGWNCPVIVMIACGGYRAGLGPFHAQTFESIAAHTPGLDVMMPSTAADAAGLLNFAFESGRPTLIFYPKSCLNLIGRSTSADVGRQFVPIGNARRLRTGRDLTLVTWGSPVEQCTLAADALINAGYSVDLFDLRSISPWDEAAVIASAEKTGRLLVVHEDNLSCGFGAEVVATVVEAASRQVRARRVTRADTFVPCHFASQLEVLPSFTRVLDTAAEMLNLALRWQTPVPDIQDGLFIVVQGSGPADESVKVVSLYVHSGDEVSVGQVVAELEATKAVFELEATCAGTVTEVLAQTGDTVRVGARLLRLQANGGGPLVPVAKENVQTPILRPRQPSLTRPSRRSVESARPATKSRLLHFGPASPTYPEGPRKLVRLPAFATAFRLASEIIDASLGWSPWKTMHDDATPAGISSFENYLVRECLFQLSLFQAYREACLTFDYVVGISIGEVAAAHATGITTFQEAVRVCCEIVHALRASAPGDLALISAPPGIVEPLLAKWGGEIYSAIEAPALSVWGVRAEQMPALRQWITGAGHEIQFLGLQCVPHSSLVDRAQIEERLKDISPRPPQVRFFSTVTGGEVTTAVGVEFWGRLITAPSLLTGALTALAAEPFDEIMRIGSVFFEGDLRAMLSDRGRDVPICDGAAALLAES